MVYSHSYGGTTAYIKAGNLKDAIEIFESEYYNLWTEKKIPYEIDKIENLGTLHE